MRGRIYLKIIFVVILTGILMGLIFIIYDRAGTRAHIYNPLELADYVIKDENKKCKAEEELIYEDEDYNYYLTCLGSYNIYLEWTDGSRDLLKNALNNKKVNMASLIEHGLEVVKHEK